MKDHIKTKMKDPGFKEAWHDLDDEFALLEGIIKARESAGLTQEEVAKKIGTKQPASACGVSSSASLFYF